MDQRSLYRLEWIRGPLDAKWIGGVAHGPPANGLRWAGLEMD